MMAANQSLKTNRSMLSNRERVKVSLVSGTDEKWVDPKQPTAAQIVAIRIKKRKERKRQVRKNWMIALVSVVITIWIIWYFLPWVIG